MGEMAVTDRWKEQPRTAVTAIGEGCALPAGCCPFSWSTAGRLREIRELAAAGMLDPSSWHPGHQGLSVDAALELEQFGRSRDLSQVPSSLAALESALAHLRPELESL